MSDWQIGDLALCIKGYSLCKPPLVTGSIYTVRDVFWGVDATEECEALELDGMPIIIDEQGEQWDGHESYRFTKVTPPAADEFDRETIALMNRVGQPA